MSIVSSVITVDRSQGNYRKITCTHTDHLAVKHIQRWKALPSDNIELTKLDKATELDAALAENEIQQHRQALENGNEPYFWDNGGLWTANAFEHVTFDESFITNMKYFLSTNNMADLMYIKTTWDRGLMSPTNTASLLGLSVPQRNAITSDMADMLNYQNGMDLYTPHFDESGSPV